MVETCSSCDKQFANRRSLSTHKSRFHNDLKDSTSRSAKHLTESVKNPDEASDTDSELSYGKDSYLNATFPPNKSGHPNRNETVTHEHSMDDNLNMENESKEYAAMSSSSDDDIETEDSASNSDIASEIGSNRISDSASEKYQFPGNKRKANYNPTHSRLVNLLSSIESALKNQSCKEEGLKCFDLLFCYTMKRHFFAELDGWFFTELGKNIEDVLTQEEQYFIDAIIATSNLSDLHRLMNENSTMVKSIFEQHQEEKKRKHRKSQI